MSGNHTFRVDTSGDTNNLIFESLYKADIPEYIHLGSVYQRNYRRTLEASSTSEVPFDSSKLFWKLVFSLHHPL